MVLFTKQAELKRATINYSVYYSMYLCWRCSLCALEIAYRVVLKVPA